MRRLLFLVLLLLSALPAQAAAPTIDASGFFAQAYPAIFGNPVSSGTIAVTTTSTDDIIVLAIFDAKQTSASTTVTSVTGGVGLTWAKRIGRTDALNGCTSIPVTACGADTELWWAYSAVAQSAANITFNLAAPMDGAVANIVGVNGASSFVAPFDPNVSLPVSASNLTGISAAVTVGGYSTSIANDLQFYFFAIVAPLSGNAGPCAPWLAAIYGESIANNIRLYLTGEYQRSAAVASGLTLFGHDVGGCTHKADVDWVIFGDAIAGSPRSATAGNLMMRAPLTGWGGM